MAPLMWFDAEDWLNATDLHSYLAALAPLAFGLMSVPTLEEARCRKLMWPRPVIIEPHELQRVHKDWVLTESSVRDGRWWTLVSYMFLHQDEQHLFGNLASIATAGREVFSSLGVVGLYAVFLLTGVAAGANQGGRLRQVEAQLAGSARALPECLGAWGVPGSVCDLLDGGLRSVAKTTAPLVNSFTVDLGASGGACGLMGFTLGLALEDLLMWFRGTRGSGQTAPSSGSNSISLRPRGGLFSLLSALDSFRFLAREWQLAQGNQGVTGVDHSGHLTGFAAGLGLLGVIRAAEYGVAALLALWRGGGPPVAPNGERRRPAFPGRRHVDAAGNLW